MPIAIYQSTLPSSKVSSSLSLTNPIVFKFTNAGGVEERQLFLRHDSLSEESSLDVSVGGFDLATVEGDQSSWIQVAPDSSGSAGSYGSAGAAVDLGNVNVGETVPFWIKATVPSNDEVGARDDLALQITSINNRLSLGVDISEGIFEFCEYDDVEDGVIFRWDEAGDTGDYLTYWIDCSNMDSITGFEYERINGAGSNLYVSYRTAEDDSGTNASAWFSDPSDLDLSGGWLQVKIQFVGATFITPSQGLTQYRYNDASYMQLLGDPVGVVYGVIPNHSHPGNPNMSTTTAPHGAIWKGKYIAPDTGTYAFRMAVDFTGQLFIDGNLMFQYTTAVNPGGFFSFHLDAGLHDIEVVWVDHNGGNQYCRLEVDSPSAANRTVLTTDFYDDRYGTYNNVIVHNMRVLYTGTYVQNFDLRFWNGPATPILIAPPNGSNTDDFNPPLTAITTNGDHLNFQLDMVPTFDSSNLTDWEVPCEEDVECTSQSPVFDRPSGVWYWRARSILDGVYGNWSDPWILTINPFVGRNGYLYINVNNGFELVDPLTVSQYVYINVNQGPQEDTIYRNRHIYVNVNVDFAIGEIIYPIQDKTAVRKRDFTEDSQIFL